MRQQRSGVAKRLALNFTATIVVVATATGGAVPAHAADVDFQIWQNGVAAGYPGDDVAVAFDYETDPAGPYQASQSFNLVKGFTFAAPVGTPMTGVAGGCNVDSTTAATCSPTTPATGSGVFHVVVPGSISSKLQNIGTGTIDTPSQHTDADPSTNTETFQVNVLKPPAIVVPAERTSVAPGAVGFSGTAEKNTPVTVTDSTGGTVCQTISAGDGTWSCQAAQPRPEGLGQQFTPQVTSPNKNRIVKGPVRTISVFDPAQRPGPPGLVVPVEGGPVSGTGVPGNKVVVKGPGGGEVCSPYPAVGKDSRWTCQPKPSLNIGDKVSATQVDGYQRVSDPATTVVEFDPANRPAAPVVKDPVEGGSVAGTGLPDHTVAVKDPSGGKVCELDPVVGKDSRWTCRPKVSLNIGDKVSVTQADVHKRVSDAATAITVFDPAKKPVAPGVDVPLEGGPVSGTGVPRNTVAVTNPLGGKVCEPDPVVGGDGRWTCQPKVSLNIGDKVSVTQADVHKRVSDPAAAIAVADPNRKPAAPGLTPLKEGEPVSGTGTAGNSITVSGPDGMKCSPKRVDSSGKWSCVPTPALQAGDVIGAKQIDPHKRLSEPATTVVAADPRKKPVLSPPLGSDPTPVLSGTGRPGDVVAVNDKASKELCRAKVDQAGRWSCTPGSPLADGVHELMPVAVDEAGKQTNGDPVKAAVSTAVDLAIAIADPEVDIVPGSRGTMQVMVTNNGALPLTKSANVIVAPPADVLVGEAQPAGCTAAGDRRSASCVIAPETGPPNIALARSLGVPRAGNEWTFTISVIVADTVKPGTTLTGGTATVSGPGIKTRAAEFAVKTPPAAVLASPMSAKPSSAAAPVTLATSATPAVPAPSVVPVIPARAVMPQLRPAASLASTGVPAEPLVALGGLMILVGAGLVAGRRSRRQAPLR